MSELVFSKGTLTLPARNRPQYLLVKRCADVAGAAILLVGLMPLMVLIALLIVLDSPGGVFYVQERMGSRRRRVGGERAWELEPFSVFKFRTMSAGADSSLHQAHVEAYVRGRLHPEPRTPARFKLAEDPRVTRFGSILRRTSLDELPQLINVIRGEMSLVGPRPVPVYEVALYEEAHHERFAARPGITGLWQVSGRCDISFEDMINLDITYARAQSFWLDAKILLLTIPAVIGGRGAA
jgi:lipopolysaccharide/colanic/teichoic acid biosynthesis glycosyltransferase